MARFDRTAFAKALHEAHEREHDQRWQDAIDLYADILASVGPSADPEGHAMRAIALMRRGGMGGPGPAPAGDPGCRPMAGRPRRGDRVLRPRGDEGEGGAPPWDAREETRVTVGPAHATR